MSKVSRTVSTTNSKCLASISDDDGADHEEGLEVGNA